jgi:hypothetical protein
MNGRKADNYWIITKLGGRNLPFCLITMQRHKGAFGYFSRERFASVVEPKEITDEIALNPFHFSTRKSEEVLSTLAHEMVHLWQHHFGERPRKGYHDRQWASKMREIGLIPTNTGETGGKETGQKMTHLIEENGRFSGAVSKLQRAHPAILYADLRSEGDAVRKRKGCQQNKIYMPGLRLKCLGKA